MPALLDLPKVSVPPKQWNGERPPNDDMTLVVVRAKGEE